MVLKCELRCSLAAGIVEVVVVRCRAIEDARAVVFDDNAVTPQLRRAELKRRITSTGAGTAYLACLCLVLFPVFCLERDHTDESVYTCESSELKWCMFLKFPKEQAEVGGLRNVCAAAGREKRAVHIQRYT